MIALPPPEALDEIDPAEAPAVLAHLLALQARVLARLATTQKTTPDRLLTVEEAAALLTKSTKWLYRHGPRLPFARKVGRSLRFSEVGARKYIERARPY